VTAHTQARKPFVVTSDYIGPDRRQGTPRPNSAAQFAVPNTLLSKTRDPDVSFVAGSPMSFIMDLYTAYYPQRAEIPVGVTAAPNITGSKMQNCRRPQEMRIILWRTYAERIDGHCPGADS
jgi:hypothetical protein